MANLVPSQIARTYKIKWYVLGTPIRPPYKGSEAIIAENVDSAVAQVKRQVAGRMLFRLEDVHINSILVEGTSK